MLGDKIGEETGHVKVQRVLPNPGIPKMEQRSRPPARFSARRTRRPARTSMLRPDGTVYGEGAGLVMGKEGEMASWVGQGVGTFKKDGGISYRGSIYYQSASPKWARLGTVASVFDARSTPRGPRALRSLNGSSVLRSVHGARSRASRRAMRLSDIFGWAALAELESRADEGVCGADS